MKFEVRSKKVCSSWIELYFYVRQSNKIKKFLSYFRSEKYKNKQIKRPISKIRIMDGEILSVNLFDPIFLRACGETVEILRKEFGKDMHMIYTYTDSVLI